MNRIDLFFIIAIGNFNLLSQSTYSVSLDPSPRAPFDVIFTPNVGAIQYDVGAGAPPQFGFSIAPVIYTDQNDGKYWTTTTYFDFDSDPIGSSSQQVVMSGFFYLITNNTTV